MQTAPIGQMRKYQRFLRISTQFVATVAAVLTTNPSHADWYYPLVRITCIPEVGYAAVETFGLYNIGTSVTPVPTSLANQGIHELRSLDGKPVTCDLPQGKLVIEILNYHAPQAKGSCGGVEDADLRVSLAGAEIALAKGTHGGCGGSQRHDIQISHYELQHCIQRFEQATQIVAAGDFTSVETMCKNVPLR